MHIARPHHRICAQPVPEHFRIPPLLPQLPSPLVIAIDHRILRSRTARPRKQQFLRRKIILHRVMKVEMVARQIGKHGSVKMQPVNPSQSQRMRRNFHRRRLLTACHQNQFRQHPHQVQRFRRSIRSRQHLRPQPILNRPRQHRRPPRRPQNRIQQITRRGLAVRPRNTSQSHRLIRFPVKRFRGHRQRMTPMLHLNPRNTRVIRCR